MLLAFVAALALASASAGDLAPGPLPVGFRQMTAASAAPPWLGARSIEVSLWYPAGPAGTGTPLNLGRYLDLSPDLVRRTVLPGVSSPDRITVLSTAMTGAADALPREAAERLLDEPMLARENAPQAGGPFPIVLWTTRYGTTAAQAPLSEFLASHGYLVAFARPAEAAETLPFELHDSEARLEELDRQIGDLRGALRAVRALPESRPDQVAIVAWSYAGEAAARVAFGDHGIREVIALSSNTLGDWVYQPAAAADRLAPSLLAARHWVVTEERGRDGTPRAKPSNWDRLPPGSAFVRVPGMAHGSFNALEGYLPSLLGLTRAQPWSRVGPEARVGYAAVARLILAALRGEDELPRALTVERRMGRATERVAPATTVLETTDGVRVTADVYEPHGPRVGCALLLHQSGGSRGEYRVVGPELATRGWRVLAPDLRFGRQDRATGVPNETARSLGAPAIQDRGDREALRALNQASRADVEASLVHLAAGGCRDVVVWGSSMTTIPALERARDDARVRAAILFSPGEYVRDDPEAVRRIARAVRRPVLVVHGRGEAELARPVADAVTASERTLHASDLGAHGSSILVEDGGAWAPVFRFLEGLARRP